MPTLYLILAHFIADLVLQPDRIVQMKHEGWKGNAIHAAIHGATALVILLPFLPNFAVFSAILIVSVSHFFIDSAKIEIEKKANRYVKIFLIDQSAHLLLIAGAGYLLHNESPAGWFLQSGGIAGWYLNPFVAAGLIILLLSTYGYELFLYQFRRGEKKEPVFKPDNFRMIRNLLICTIIYALFLVFGVFSVAVTGGGTL